MLGNGFIHLHVDECESTNSELLNLPAGHDRLWLTADSQTGGRGRSGRNWISSQGNLFASVRVENPSAPEHAAGLSFVLALAAKDAVREVADGLDVKLKWPNDMLVSGKKLAGILLEATSDAAGQITTVCGVGINCRYTPDSQNTLYAATSLMECGYAVEPAQLFSKLTVSFAKRLAQWDRGAGMASICADWKQVAAGIGTEIKARTGETERRGIFRDITPEGHLILETQAGIETITAADIFLA